MVSIHDVRLADGRNLRVHDSGNRGQSEAFTVVWHHGTPQTGAPLAPLLAATAERGMRLISYGRPGYGGSSPLPGRNVASAASDVAAAADALGVDRFAVMGASGGGPHALACAALLPDRVTGVVCLASPAPFGVDGLDFFTGMADEGALRAALAGPEARVRHEATAEFDPTSFNDRDYAALEANWSSLGADVGVAAAAGPDGAIADDLALVAPWGFNVAQITAPVLLVQGGQDRVIPPSHAKWLLSQIPEGELWLRPNDGHIAILDAGPLALDWLRAHA
jgi:pimeloyl-ACP methyl ester carboxylesterase